MTNPRYASKLPLMYSAKVQSSQQGHKPLDKNTRNSIMLAIEKFSDILYVILCQLR